MTNDKQFVDRIYLRDGREAEQRVVERVGNDGSVTERVTEIHAEPVKTMSLEQRVTERVKPIVFEREIDTIKDGQVTEKKVETIDPEVKMELRQHVGFAPAPVETRVVGVTKEDLHDLLMEFNGPRQPARSALQDDIAARVKAMGSDTIWVLVGLAVIAAQVAALAYFIFVY